MRMRSTTRDQVESREWGVESGARALSTLCSPLSTLHFARRAGQAPRRNGSSRRAFTLIELMVVIVVIAILLSIIVPAVQGARVKVTEAAVINEINQLSNSIATFQARFGVEPPSQFSIYLTQAGWSGDPAAMAAMRRIWPQF